MTNEKQERKDNSLFESIMGVHTKDEYVVGVGFRIKQMTAQLMLISYLEQLKKNKLNIFKVIEWFYGDYLKKEFEVNDFL